MYKCTNTFIAENNVSYSYGDRISYSEYSDLQVSEQYNFKKEDDVIDDIIDTVATVGIIESIADIFSSNDDSSSDSSFGGFGGGDFGGGGASGGW